MEKLAIEGGPKTVNEKLSREWPGTHWIGDEERELVMEALVGNAFSGKLAEDLCDFYGCAWAIPTNSGTSALFGAMAGLDIGPGMEVLIPGFCWIPTFSCVVNRGAIPVLVEVGEDLGIDPKDLEKKITPRSKAVIVAHMCGGAANMDPIMDIARKHKLMVIEDCAQDGAGKYKGKFVGLFGDIGCFSLQQNKHFTSFLGGYIISSEKTLEHATTLSVDCGLGRVMNVVSYELEEEVMWGMGRRLNPLAEAMARAQLKKAPRIIGSMQRAKRRIVSGIKDIQEIRFRPLADPKSDCGSFLITYWPDAERAYRAAAALKAEGVPEWIFHLQDYGTHMYYHMLMLKRKIGWARGSRCPWECKYNEGSSYSYEKGALPESDEIFSRGVVMAVPSVLTDGQCDKIAEAYRKVAVHLL